MSTESIRATTTMPYTMYAQLHSEINDRLKMRQDILTFTLIIAASLFGLGLQRWASALTVLCYPVLALFLAQAWQQHDKKIGEIACYCRKLEEDMLDGYPGWEQWRRQAYPSTGRLIAIPARGIFLVSEALAVPIAVARFTSSEGQPSPEETMVFFLLLAFAAIAFLLTWQAISHERQR